MPECNLCSGYFTLTFADDYVISDSMKASLKCGAFPLLLSLGKPILLMRNGRLVLVIDFGLQNLLILKLVV